MREVQGTFAMAFSLITYLQINLKDLYFKTKSLFICKR